MTNDLEMRADTDETLKIEYLAADGVTPIDITGYTVFFTVKPKPDTVADDTGAIIKATQIPAQLTDPTNGITTITIPRSDMNVDAGDYVYDVKFKLPTSENIEFVVGGPIVIKDIVTNRVTA